MLLSLAQAGIAVYRLPSTDADREGQQRKHARDAGQETPGRH